MERLPGASWTGCSKSRGFKIEGISGTSAGAMNGAMAVVGYETGGADGARAMLDQFWHKVRGYGPVRAGPSHAVGPGLGRRTHGTWTTRSRS